MFAVRICHSHQVFFFFVLDTHDPDKNEIPLTIDRLTGKRNLLLIIPGSKSKLFF